MTKLYRTRQEFRYAPTGFLYAVGIVDPLADWHPDDIKEALRNLIEEVDTPDTPTVATTQPDISEIKKPAEGTHRTETEN